MAFAPRPRRPLPVLAKKRRALSKSEDKVVLERVLGLTCVNNNSLAVSSTNHCIAYPAGCTVVLFYPKKNKQCHIINPSRKPISCLCLGSDKYLAYGECGHSPSIRVWDVSSSTPIEVSKLNGHAFGVSCLVFSPNLRYLVSVGYQHDQNVFVWNWKTNSKLATNKMTTKVNGISFSEDGKYWVTVGNRRVRYWYFDTTMRDSKSKATLPLTGRSAILGDQQSRKFSAVSCGRGSFAKYTYVVSACGLLFQFNEEREIDKMLDVRSGRGYCVCVTGSHVVVGCGDGVIRLFDPLSLDYVVSLPRPHCLGVELSAANNDFISEKGKNPDTVAMVFDFHCNKLVTIYNDHSLYTWDLKNLSQIGKAYSCLYHSACVWDISLYSPAVSQDRAAILPLSSFITCSSDNTIRFWLLEPSNQGEFCFKNIFSKELMRVIYDTEDINSLKDTSQLPGDCSAVADANRGTRCVEVHPQGHQIAAGDRQGNLKIYDLDFTDQAHDIMAHDAEILSVAYSQYRENKTMWLATASRDRLIHLFDVSRGYSHAHTICDHSAAITSVKFIANSDVVHLIGCGADKSLMVQELGEGLPQDGGRPSVKRINHVVEKSTMYDMIVDPTLKTISTVGQDRLIKVYGASSCKQKVAYRGGASDESSVLLRVTIDPSGLLIATSSSDKTVCIFEFSSGECVAKLHGHSEVITALKFSSCCCYLYTASGDRLPTELTQRMHARLADIGQLDRILPTRDRYEIRKETYCVPTTATTTATTTKTAATTTTDTASNAGSLVAIEEDYSTSDIAKNNDTGNTLDATDDDGFKSGLNQLPSWAQNQVITRPSVAASIGVVIEQDKPPIMESHVSHVTGKWAERVEESAQVLTVDSEPDSEIIDEEECDESVLNFEAKISLEDLRMDLEDILPDEEEVVYPVNNGRESVDPSMFKVSTPEKKKSFVPTTTATTAIVTAAIVALQENKENMPVATDVVCGSDSNDEEEAGEEESEGTPSHNETFLKTTFESLLSADELLDMEAEIQEWPPIRRPSISTKYLKKSRSRFGNEMVQPIQSLPIDMTTPTQSLPIGITTHVQSLAPSADKEFKNTINFTTPLEKPKCFATPYDEPKSLTTSPEDKKILITPSEDTKGLTTPSEDTKSLATPSGEPNGLTTPSEEPMSLTTPSEKPLSLTTPSEDSIGLTTPASNFLEAENKKPAIDSNVPPPDDETNDNVLSSDSNGDLQSRPRPMPSDKKSTRAKITLEEIDKARKRLEELGYSKEYIHGGSKSLRNEEEEHQQMLEATVKETRCGQEEGVADTSTASSQHPQEEKVDSSNEGGDYEEGVVDTNTAPSQHPQGEEVDTSIRRVEHEEGVADTSTAPSQHPQGEEVDSSNKRVEHEEGVVNTSIALSQHPQGEEVDISNRRVEHEEGVAATSTAPSQDPQGEEVNTSSRRMEHEEGQVDEEGLEDEMGGVKGGEGDVKMLDAFRAIAMDLNGLTSAIEQGATPSSSSLDSYVFALLEIRQSVERLEEVIREKSKVSDSLAAVSCSYEGHGLNTPAQPYLSSVPRVAVGSMTLVSSGNMKDGELTAKEEGQPSLQNSVDLVQVLQGPDPVSHDPGPVLQDPGPVSQDPGSVSSPVFEDSLMNSAIKEPSQGNVNTSTAAIVLDPAVIQPLIEEYSKQLIEAVKLHLPNMK